MTSEIDKLKHFHVENYSGTNFTDDLNISPLKFTDDEWCQISSDGTCQNRRKGDVFKEPDGSIHYNVSKRRK